MHKSLSFIVALFMVFLTVSSLTQAQSPVGVQLYSFREQFAKDVKGTMQKVKDMGITYCEVAGYYGMDAKSFKAILDEYGIKPTGTGAGFDQLADPEKLKTVISEAKILGAKTVMCAWIPHNGTDFTIQDVEKAVKVFNEAGKTLAANGLSLLYHNHGYEFRSYKDHYLMDEIITRTNPSYVNFEMDILWTQHPGHNPVAWMKKYPTRWKAMHVKDRKKGTAGNQFGTMDVDNDMTLGEGDLNIADIIKQARQIGIKHFYIEDESPRSLEQVPHSIAFLKPMF
ncbi:sugar phosphate isomerase/epimerase family protein [Xanthocytophaga flava]|uniref:sugar phosphate isomerase/epimerase family protein n=1 Tax=Xanthocytophaga flava TaxID=3048013 RepID=UPI0028D8D264|nr:sugar phosphate isomerase/epimerase [Xanthocytophaga flavus]MDJ1469336.1 sugar phosphate isomerase/epimerase [Xanthocytophaga flavus]